MISRARMSTADELLQLKEDGCRYELVKSESLHEDDVLELDDVVPGWTLSVRDALGI